MNPCPKPTRWKSKRYLDWIKTLECFCCSKPAEPHHIKGVGNMSGGGMKAPDWAVMPLCHNCHDAMHRRSDLWPDQWEMIARTLGRAIEEGLLE